MKKKQLDIEEHINEQTGEILDEQPKINQILYTYSKRPNGSLRIQMDFQNCPTLAEQHSSHVTDLNYLISKFKPDELAAYIAARAQHRQEIIGHDFSNEPSLQEARNITYKLKKSFDELPDEVKYNFKNHVEFLKFINNPANAEKMIKLGLMTKKQVQDNTINDKPNDKQQNPEQPKNTKGQQSSETKASQDAT